MLFVKASSQWARRYGVPLPAAGSIALWARMTTSTSNGWPFSIGWGTTGPMAFRFTSEGFPYFHPFGAYCTNYSSISDGKWALVCHWWNYNANTSGGRAISLEDGYDQPLGTVGGTMSGGVPTASQKIEYAHNLAQDTYHGEDFDGDVAHFTLWQGIQLQKPEIYRMARGEHPASFHRHSLLFYEPLEPGYPHPALALALNNGPTHGARAPVKPWDFGKPKRHGRMIWHPGPSFVPAWARGSNVLVGATP